MSPKVPFVALVVLHTLVACEGSCPKVPSETTDLAFEFVDPPTTLHPGEECRLTALVTGAQGEVSHVWTVVDGDGELEATDSLSAVFVGGRLPTKVRLQIESEGQVVEDSITIDRSNRPPVLDFVPEDFTVRPEHRPTLRAEASDPDGDPLTYVWTNEYDESNDPDAQPLEGQEVTMGPFLDTSHGSWEVRVVVQDGFGGEATETLEITVIDGRDVCEPVLSQESGAPGTTIFGSIGVPEVFQEELSYHWTLPDGTEITDESFEWTVPQLRAGQHRVNVEVEGSLSGVLCSTDARFEVESGWTREAELQLPQQDRPNDMAALTTYDGPVLGVAGESGLWTFARSASATGAWWVALGNRPAVMSNRARPRQVQLFEVERSLYVVSVGEDTATVARMYHKWNTEWEELAAAEEDCEKMVAVHDGDSVRAFCTRYVDERHVTQEYRLEGGAWADHGTLAFECDGLQAAATEGRVVLECQEGWQGTYELLVSTDDGYASSAHLENVSEGEYAVDESGRLHVIHDSPWDDIATLFRLEGDEWTEVAQVSAAAVNDLTFVHDVPCIIRYDDDDNLGVMCYRDGEWELIGAEDSFPSIVLPRLAAYEDELFAFGYGYLVYGDQDAVQVFRYDLDFGE